MNLTKTSKMFRVGIIVGAIVVVTYYILSLVVIPQTKRAIKLYIAKRNPPNIEFGLLDQLEFIEKPINGTGTPRITLETKTGQLPENIPDKMLVYKVRPKRFSYLATGNAIKDAESLGFLQEDLITDLKGPRFKWRSLASGGILDIDSSTMYLSVLTDMQRLAGKANGGLNKQNALNYATVLFDKLGRIDDTYKNDRAQVYLGNFSNTQLSESPNDETSDIARVELFRKIGKYDVYTPDPTQGLLRVYLRNPIAVTPLNYPIIESYYREIITPSTATYPILPVEQAWEAIQSGKGILASVAPRNLGAFEDYAPVLIDSITINNIKLAYYETAKTTSFIQPIYVFEGFYSARSILAGNVAIYYPAIPGEHIKK